MRVGTWEKVGRNEAMSTFTPTFIALHNFLLWNQRDALVGAKDTMLVLANITAGTFMNGKGGPAPSIH